MKGKLCVRTYYVNKRGLGSQRSSLVDCTCLSLSYSRLGRTNMKRGRTFYLVMPVGSGNDPDLNQKTHAQGKL